jgi:predicted phosphoribosyltransferase
VAKALDAPLDVFLVRKLGVPGQEELALGAIASGGVRVMNERVMEMVRATPAMIERIAANEQIELDRRERDYRGRRPGLDLREKTVILVDDGLATGSTMHAAVSAVRRLSPTRVVVAVPVGSPQTCAEFETEADEVVCVLEPEPFYAVGQWYQDFSQTTDQEVRDLLARARPAGVKRADGASV